MGNHFEKNRVVCLAWRSKFKMVVVLFCCMVFKLKFYMLTGPPPPPHTHTHAYTHTCIIVIRAHAHVHSTVEPPEMIDSHELKYPDRPYHVKNLEAPEPILGSSLSSGNQATPTAVHYSCDGDARVTGIVSTETPARLTARGAPKAETVNFPISKIHSIKESHHTKRSVFI